MFTYNSRSAFVADPYIFFATEISTIKETTDKGVRNPVYDPTSITNNESKYNRFNMNCFVPFLS